MNLSVPRVKHYLHNGTLAKLFIEELGWDKLSATLPVAVGGHTFSLTALAEKRGVVVYECPPDADGSIPDYATRRAIEKEATKAAFEHLLIFVDRDKATQVWQWVARTPGQPAAYREVRWHKGQTGDALVQKLNTISIPLDEDEALDLTGAVTKLRDAFDRDKVTKKFFDQFKAEHKQFLDFITGIDGVKDREWYASLMLNRLMFVYFIQKKGFLDGNPDYLRDKLAAVKAKKGKGKFHTFYRLFLRALFHDGFGQAKPRKMEADLAKLLGEVPYLNGGLFEVHQLEANNPDIEIPDDAFDRLFAFFDKYEWHLDSRPLAAGNEINPDVLGYIFEKYINQKQMGAYYTKEDITDYIGKNTIIPRLFDMARERCEIAFAPGSVLWKLLSDNPDRYLYPAVRHGVIDKDGQEIPLPPNIAIGIADVSQRGKWNRAAPELFALPTETWREHVARRQRCLELRRKLAAGEITGVNDLITFNLNIRQFAEDAIAGCEGPDLLRAFYEAITSVTVLDPTCGSGAFLFAALNILQPLYDACLDRMAAFVADADALGKPTPKTFDDFRAVLKDADAHPSRDYFVLKSVVVRNLYGVDLMPEAVEICKLRLFLKLVAQVDRADQLEPLPDIDFNIRPGNTLVGFATLAEVQTAIGMLNYEELDEIKAQAGHLAALFTVFRNQQTALQVGAISLPASKPELRDRLKALAAKLDAYLASAYDIITTDTEQLAAWQKSHQPFHWFAEFHAILSAGGFDVVIGNPPYLEKSKLAGAYSVLGFQTRDCRDIYAWCVERSVCLLGKTSRLGLIIPVSVASSGNFQPLRLAIRWPERQSWLSHFANRPSQLFSGAQNRLTILIQSATSPSALFSTRYHRWDGKNGERDTLFPTLTYAAVQKELCQFHGLLPKVGRLEPVGILRRVLTAKAVSSSCVAKSKHPVFWVRVPGYFCQFFIRAPLARPEGGGATRVRGEVNSIQLKTATESRVLHAVLNSSLWFQFYVAYTDGRHINPSDVKDFPFDLTALSQDTTTRLVELSKLLEQEMANNTSQWRKSGLLIDSVNSSACKPILDDIDRVLADHYGFTAEELDFILNYDIKYRLGADESGEGDDEV